MTVILADGRTTSCAKEVLLDLQLTTAAGVVNVRQVPCLVMTSEDDELLVGSDTLASLGISVEDMLAQLAGSSILPTEEDEFPVGYELLVTRDQSGTELAATQMGFIDQAVQNGFPVERHNELKLLLSKYDDIWGNQASPSPPAKVEPRQVTIQEGTGAVRCHGRPYPPLQRTFIREYVSQLLERGLIRKNNSSRWASPVVPVRKPGTEDQFRLTIDYHVVNSKTVPLAGRMPTQGEVLDAVRGSKYFARFDLPEGFWQFPDIISRWRSSTVVTAAAVRTRRDRHVSVSEISQLRPLQDLEFVFPTLDDVREAQEVAGRQARERLREPSYEEGGVVMVSGKPWVPSTAKDLLARIFVVAHCGSHGHRGQDVMCTVLEDRFHILLLTKKVAFFIGNCLLCKHMKGPRQITRPYGPTYTATKRNEAVHYDFLYLGESYGDTAYVLVMKDSMTHYCELFPCQSPTAFVAAESLLEWYKRFGYPETLMSDQDTHFRNHMIELLCTRLKIQQNFSPVYHPWLNGTVERLNKDVFQVMRALLIEHGLDFHGWSYLLPANLNHTPVRSLNGHSPIELFTGLEAPSALDCVVRRASGHEDLLTVNMEVASGFLEKLRMSLHGLLKEVLDEKERKRLQDMVAHKGTACNFEVGDFVLWSRVDQRLSNNKLLGQWVGPFQIIQSRPHSFVIKHLVTSRNLKYMRLVLSSTRIATSM